MIHVLGEMQSAICPNCGEADRFDVDITLTARVVDGKIVAYHDNAEFAEDEVIRCTSCEFSAGGDAFVLPSIIVAVQSLDGDGVDTFTESEVSMGVADAAPGEGFAQARLDWVMDRLIEANVNGPWSCEALDWEYLNVTWKTAPFEVDGEQKERLVTIDGLRPEEYGIIGAKMKARLGEEK